MTLAVSRARRGWLVAEMAALYLLAPLLVYGLVYGARLSLLIVLVPVFVLLVLALSLDKSFSWRTLLSAGISARQLRDIFALWAVLGAALVAFAYFALPESFLSFPRGRPGLWAAIMALYPLFSVTAQEIAYRVFFAHRYGEVFGGNLWLAVMVNAGLFAFGHIIFASWITVAISFAGGLIFAHRYFSSRSFWAVVLEHSLYGNLIFTVGLARYFFTGIPFA